MSVWYNKNMLIKTNNCHQEKKGFYSHHIEKYLEAIYGLTFGQKAADQVVKVVGSWTFILIQGIMLILWVLMNVLAWVYHWDPYPFIFLNLLLSIQAAFSAPVILMSQNRAAERDRKKAELDLATDRKAEREIEDLQRNLDRIEKEKIDKILAILKNTKE